MAIDLVLYNRFYDRQEQVYGKKTTDPANPNLGQNTRSQRP
jgi:hypothetical protein